MPDDDPMQMDICEEAIYSNDYTDLIYDIFGTIETEYNQKSDSCIQAINRYQKILYIRKNEPTLNILSEVGYNSIPKCYGLVNTESMEATGVLRLRRQPYINLYGQGVILAFIDTGINYTNSVFINPDNTTRILEIWDQTIRTGQPPEGIRYGSLYTREDINRALTSDNPLEIVPSTDNNGHGTYMAGIAAGNEDPENDFTGAAPLADILAVKLKPAKENSKEFFGIRTDALCYQESDILMALSYLISAAGKYNKPIVFCFGIGTNSGDHNGGSLLEQYLSTLSAIRGMGVTVAGGNEANRRHHFMGSLDGEIYEDVEIQVGEREQRFVVEMWVNSPLLFSIGIISPSGEVVEKVPARLGASQTINFLFDGTRVTVNYQILERGSGDELVFIHFETPADGLWKIRVYNENQFSGDFNMWLPMEGFISPNTFFVRSNPDITVTGPGNAYNVVTTAAYNYRNNSIYLNSGRGYTRQGRITPIITAPGVEVYGPLPGNRFGYRSGTSAAVAHAAGICALLLEWGIIDKNSPNMDTRQLIRYIITGAKQPPGNLYPNREWGYGIIDIMLIFENLRITF